MPAYASGESQLCSQSLERGALDAIPEGDGTMLDNTVVFWCNELAKGNSHDLKNSHFVVAGGAVTSKSTGWYSKTVPS